MVDRAEIGQITSLYTQYISYSDVIRLFERPLKITAFMVAPTDDETTAGTMVSAEGIATPPQMITSIKQQIESRMQSIKNALDALDAPPPTISAPPAPEPEPEPEHEIEPEDRAAPRPHAAHAPPKQQPKQQPTPPSRRR